MASTQTSSSPETLFEIVLEDATVINKIISEICNPDDNSTFIITSEGLRLIVNGDRTSQVSAFFSANTFDSFQFKADEDIRYKFALKDFIETLSILREEPTETDQVPAKTALKITYRRRGEPLKLRLDNRTNYFVECDLREFSALSVHSLMSFEDFEETAEIHFHSKELYKYISGLDLISSTFLKIVLELNLLKQDPIPVRMTTESPTLGEVELEIRPEDQSDMREPIIMRNLSMPENQIYQFCYRSKFVAPALEALRTSNYVRMKCGQSGLLLMEHFYGKEPRVQSVQYFVLSEAA